MSEQSTETGQWRDALVSERERRDWETVDNALRPFLRCDPNNHHPLSCPAVRAVMEALGLHKEGVFRGTPGEMFGPVPPEVQERYERTLRQIEEAERAVDLTLVVGSSDSRFPPEGSAS